MTDFNENTVFEEDSQIFESCVGIEAGPAIDPVNWPNESEIIPTCIGCGRPASEHDLRDCPEWY